MASPDLELQGAVVSRLKATSGVTAQLAERVYDHVPDNPDFPYIAIGDAQFVRADTECRAGGEVFLTLHVWSRDVGFPECKRIASAVEDSLHMAPMTMPTHRLVSLMHRNTRIFRDPDGSTSHGVVEFVASVHKPLS